MQTPSLATGCPTGTVPSQGNATVYPGGPIPSYGNAGAGNQAGYQNSQQTCWNPDWLFCVLGLICTPLWCVGACLPLCRRPKLPTTSSKVGWAFNLVLSIFLLAVVIVAVVLVVKHVKNDVGVDPVPSGTNDNGSSCSLIQQDCKSTADCCTNTDAGSGLICTTQDSEDYALMCLVKEDYACTTSSDCICNTGCDGENLACSTASLTYHTCQPTY